MVTAPLACPRQSPKSDIRLQKYLAICGVGSRRACERLIEAGRVAVDGKRIESKGVKIDPARQSVELDGRALVPEPKLYIAFNKPRGVLCTSSDPAGRKTFRSFFSDLPARVFTVGRLDRDSEGLILVTSDGEFANLISHPRYGIEKTYLVAVNRSLAETEQNELLRGISSNGELLRALAIRETGGGARRCVYEVRINEGKNRHIRRMFEALNVKVIALRRIAVGPLRLGSLPPGKWRFLNSKELDAIRCLFV